MKMRAQELVKLAVNVKGNMPVAAGRLAVLGPRPEVLAAIREGLEAKYIATRCRTRYRSSIKKARVGISAWLCSPDVFTLLAYFLRVELPRSVVNCHQSGMICFEPVNNSVAAEDYLAHMRIA